jgi:hypothetical protein
LQKVRKTLYDTTWFDLKLIGFDFLKADNNSKFSMTKPLSSYAGHTILCSLTCTLVITTTSTVVVTIHKY